MGTSVQDHLEGVHAVETGEGSQWAFPSKSGAWGVVIDALHWEKDLVPTTVVHQVLTKQTTHEAIDSFMHALVVAVAKVNSGRGEVVLDTETRLKS
jgi:hypothetical protein